MFSVLLFLVLVLEWFLESSLLPKCWYLTKFLNLAWSYRFQGHLFLFLCKCLLYGCLPHSFTTQKGYGSWAQLLHSTNLRLLHSTSLYHVRSDEPREIEIPQSPCGKTSAWRKMNVQTPSRDTFLSSSRFLLSNLLCCSWDMREEGREFGEWEDFEVLTIEDTEYFVILMDYIICQKVFGRYKWNRRRLKAESRWYSQISFDTVDNGWMIARNSDNKHGFYEQHILI